MSPSPWYLVGSTLSYVEVIIIRVNVWKCPSEDKTILILSYETYINKKLSDCLVGVFGVDSEKSEFSWQLLLKRDKSQPGKERSIRQEKDGVGDGDRLGEGMEIWGGD